MAHLAISLLGPFQATLEGLPVTTFKYDKVRALLAYLAVESEFAHEREALLGLLWPDLPEDAARNNLRQTLLTLRDAIGDRTAQPPLLLASRASLQFNPDADYSLDVKTFLELLNSCTRHLHANPLTCRACANRRQVAVDLYKGDFLTEFFLPDSDSFEEWALVKREWLHRQMMETLSQLVAYHERRGNYGETLRYAARQIMLDTWREETHRQLMRLYVLNGERSAALAQYENCCNMLQQELGVEPETETTTLYEQIRDVTDSTFLPATQLALPAVRRHNLPPVATPFIGREQELAAIARLLNENECRLLTLTGSGGVGKTRLALQVAIEQVDTFADGVFYIPLVILATPELLANMLLNSLHLDVSAVNDAKSALLSNLRDKEMLLVLDNFEHLLPGAELLVDLLGAAPQVIMLVTSRERLNIQHEWLFTVEGLPVPTGAIDSTTLARLAENDAVQLFVQSAQRLFPEFELSEATGASVARICQLAEGMPLAIELAATWVRLLTCQEIVRELERGIHFLTTTLRDVPLRHRSLTAVFDYSWQLLSGDEQRVLSRFAVFRGGFGREAAETVAGATLPILRSLVDKSLLRHHVSGRFELHELIRQYVEQQLVVMDRQPMLQERHAAYFLNVAEMAAQDLRGPQQTLWLAQLAQEEDNLRAALQWAINQRQAEMAGRFCYALEYFWDSNSRLSEGKHWLEQALQLLGSDDSAHTLLRANVLNSLGNVVCEQGDLERATTLYEEGLALQRLLNRPEGIARVLNNVGHIAYRQGDAARSLALFEESLSLYRMLEDNWAIGRLLSNIGAVLCEQGNFEKSEQYNRESLALRLQLDDTNGIATSFYNLAEVLHRQGKDEKARGYFQESLALYRQLHHSVYMAATLCALGTVTLLMGDATAASNYLKESLQISREVDAQHGLAAALEGLGGVAGAQGQPEWGALFLGAAEKHRESIGLPLLNVERQDYLCFVHIVEAKFKSAKMGSSIFAESWAKGRAMPIEQVITTALRM